MLPFSFLYSFLCVVFHRFNTISLSTSPVWIGDTMPLCFSHELHSLHTIFLFGCCQSCAIHLHVRSRPRQMLSTYLLMRLLSLFNGIIHLAFVTHIYWARIVFGSYPHPLFLIQKQMIQMSSFSTAKALAQQLASFLSFPFPSN